MAGVKVTLKNGEVRDFPGTSRSGGSYGCSVRYEGAFVIVKDEWGKETAFPAADVTMVEKEGPRRW